MIAYPKVRAFLRAAETLNFTKAAALMYVTQPTLSKMIALFEEECGYPLFERNNHTVSLTREGELLYERLKSIDDGIVDAIVEVRSVHKGKTGNLKFAVGAIEPMAYVVYSAMNSFRRDYPNIGIEITRYAYSAMNEQTLSEKYDGFFMMNFDNVYDLPTIDLYKRTPVFEISKDHPIFVNQEKVAPIDFKNIEFVSLYKYDAFGYNDLLEKIGKAYGFVPNVTKYAKRIAECRSLVMIDNYAFMSFFDAPQIDGVIRIPLEVPDKINAVFSWSKSNNNPALPLFIDYLKEHI